MSSSDFDQCVRAVLVQMGYNNIDQTIEGRYAPYQHAADIVHGVLKAVGIEFIEEKKDATNFKSK